MHRFGCRVWPNGQATRKVVVAGQRCASSTSRQHIHQVRQGVLDVCSLRQLAKLATPTDTQLEMDAVALQSQLLAQTDTTSRQQLQSKSAVLSSSSSLAASVAAPRPIPADVFGTILEGRLLQRIDLTLSKVSASFNRSNLTGACLDGAILNRCTFHLTLLEHCSAVDARFVNCSFLGSSLARFDGRMAKFLNCTFHRCDLTSLRACGAVFSGCTFHKCSMNDWEYDGQTTFSSHKTPTSSTQDGWRQSDESLRRFGAQDVQVLTDSQSGAAASPASSGSFAELFN